MSKTQKTMDGNEAAAYASYPFIEIAAIYPITPSSPMAQHVDTWAANGKKNLFGQTVNLVEMQSEKGAVSSMHGALDAGTLATSYSASQGLMLMLPTMYRIAGQLKPGVIHVSSRTVATHAISIFAEHNDVMAARQTGFALLASSSVQQAMDLGAVSHLAAIKGHIPFLHFFDGFRTSHEIQKIECLDYDELDQLVDYTELEKFRKGSLNPERPIHRTTGQNPDVYFQSKEASNIYYEELPNIVEYYLEEMNKITGRNYKLFNYYGAEDARKVIVGMGSVAGAAKETVDYLMEQGEKVGYLEVHLYRPFSVEHFLKEIPKTVEKITVMDRTKEPGAVGEPLFEDISSVFQERSEEYDIKIYACRYGLGSKDTRPNHIAAVFDNMNKEIPKNHFTVGINDDVTNLSIPVGEEINTSSENTYSCKFWGFGSDGTVSANKNTIKIIGDYTDKYVQGYFEYDGKKSGGVTKSNLRFGDEPIKSSYLVKQADFVACHKQSYLEKYDIAADLKKNGTLLIECDWDQDELDKNLPTVLKKEIAEKNIDLYVIDAVGIAADIGLGNRINTVLQSAFFKITEIIPVNDAVSYIKDAILKSYGKKGDKVVNMNYKAVDLGMKEVEKIDIPEKWADLKESDETKNERDIPDFIKNIVEPVNKMKGDEIPVSEFVNRADGTVPLGTSKYEKRGIAVKVPEWQADYCIQCNQCSLVCPHAAIRPFLFKKEEVSDDKSNFEGINALGKDLKGYQYRIQVSPLDCTGCGVCAETCPAPTKALVMDDFKTQLEKEKDNWDYAVNEIGYKDKLMNHDSVKGSQFQQPLLEFSGACAGCGETPYAKLITQLYGDRMFIATATGCSQVWSSSFPSFPYTKNDDGVGPASSGSLFENNAEYAMGIYLSVQQQRNRLLMKAKELLKRTSNENLKTVINNWITNFNDGDKSKEASNKLKEFLEDYSTNEEEKKYVEYILDNDEHLIKKSIWAFGGDGWAYDIGYGGLDHVIASGIDINILVMDTEAYSNTGGQASKSSPKGSVLQFAASGKKQKKKDLGQMAMTYDNVYVAQVAMGANQSQLLKAIKEAESYNGPSIIIAYSTCIAHGLKCGMQEAQKEMKEAVDAGYWHLYRYNPELIDKNENPFKLDSKEPTGNYKEFLRREVRYTALERSFPEIAEKLFEESKNEAENRYQTYKELSDK